MGLPQEVYPDDSFDTVKARGAGVLWHRTSSIEHGRKKTKDATRREKEVKESCCERKGLTKCNVCFSQTPEKENERERERTSAPRVPTK